MRYQIKPLLRRMRLGVWYVLRAIGFFDLLANSKWRRQRLLILCYHGVSIDSEHEWHPGLFVTREFLRARLQILEDLGCNVLRLDEAIQRLQDRTLPAKSVVLTFDDGFFNFFSEAAPILEEFGMPATNYVSTYYVENQRPITALAARYLLYAAKARTLPEDSVFRGHKTVDLRNSKASSEFIDNFLNRCTNADSDKDRRLQLLRNLATAVSVDWERFSGSRMFGLMSRDELADMARRGFDIQLHTHRHRTPRDAASFSSEILQNRRILEEATGRTASHFCYPSGDVDPMFLPLLRQLNVKSATTGSVRLAASSDNPLLLPRFIDTMSQSSLQFESWVTGVAGFFRWRSR